jgi:hypothetical protein
MNLCHSRWKTVRVLQQIRQTYTRFPPTSMHAFSTLWINNVLHGTVWSYTIYLPTTFWFLWAVWLHPCVLSSNKTQFKYSRSVQNSPTPCTEWVRYPNKARESLVSLSQTEPAKKTIQTFDASFRAVYNAIAVIYLHADLPQLFFKPLRWRIVSFIRNSMFKSRSNGVPSRALRGNSH